MRNRAIFILALMLGFVLSFDPSQTAQSRLMNELETAEMDMAELYELDSALPAENSGKRGNKFVRVMKAPFKAIGKLLGKKDTTFRRLSEKDVKQFETAKVTRTTDAHLVGSAPANDEKVVRQLGPGNEQQALEHLERGRGFLRNSQLNEAIAELSLAASLNPKLKEAHNLLGIAYERKGLRDRALNSLKKAVRGDNDDPQHLNNMGFILYRNGEYKSAVKYLKRAAKLAPQDQLVWNNLGLAQAQLGRFDDAYKSFARAAGEFEGRMNIATRLARMGRHKEAVKHLEQARALKPDSLAVLARLILLYDRTGRREESEGVRAEFLAIQAMAATPGQ